MKSPLSGMRIIALPLAARATSSPQKSSGVLPLTYYHFQTPPPKNDPKGKQRSIVKRVTTKAAYIWAGFGKAPDTNWKRKVFIYGEKLIDRVDFEELSLKGIDPSLGPRIGQVRQEAEKVDALVKIPLLYPPSCYLGPISGSSPLPHIQSLLSKRTPHHRKGFYVWLGVAPLTAPFALIPIVPNLPFFYAAWRAWSHYRAWKASQYLEALIKSNHIVPQPSLELEEVYASSQYPSTPFSNTDSKPPATEQSNPDESQPHHSPQHNLLLSPDAVPKILEIFHLADSAKAEILRAIEQAKVRIKKDDIS